MERRSQKEDLSSEQQFESPDEAIGRILRKIHEKWGGVQEAKQEYAIEDVQETVVLSADHQTMKPASFALKKKQNDIPETVILSPSGPGKREVSPLSSQKTKAPEPMEETVILPDSDSTVLLKKEGKKQKGHDFLTETVLLKPTKKKDSE